MKAALLVEDRDLAFLFLDPHCAHHNAAPFDVEVADGVKDVQDENEALWLEKEGNILRVVLLDGFDFKAMTDETGFSVPTPVVVKDMAEYDRLQAEWS